MAESYSRSREGFRFSFNGMKLNAPPDSLPDGKFAAAINIRGYGDHTTRTRPGQSPLFTMGQYPCAAIRGYAPLDQSNIGAGQPPRYLATDTSGGVYLDTSQNVGSLAGDLGETVGVSMVPFRPNQSPNPYMYVASATDYQKFSAPSPTGVVTQQKVGIVEPQAAPDASPVPQSFTQILAPGGIWTTGGTASGLFTANRSVDTVAIALPDPVNPFRFSVRVSPAVQYQRGEIVATFPSGDTAVIEDVLPPLSISMTVQGIYYFSGNTGRCIIVPQGVNVTGQGVPEAAPASGTNDPLQTAIATLQRGSLLQIGIETVYVWSVIPGPDQSLAIETSTVGTHAPNAIITGVPCIVLNGFTPANITSGSQLVGDILGCRGFAVGVGVGTLTAGNVGDSGTLVARPTTLLNGWGPNAHVGAYEIGGTFGWGIANVITLPYNSPQLAYDGNDSTAATVALSGSFQYAGCVWAFPSVPPGTSGLQLNILSQVPVVAAGNRSAGLWYSLDGGVTWNQIYNAVSRGLQWDTISLPSNQNTSLVQVMAFTDSHNAMSHNVFEIAISTAGLNPSIEASTGAYTDEDYLHFSVLTDNPLNLIELRLQFDVGDGTFTQNYYYASVSPSQLVPATSGTTVGQIGAVQAYLQAEQIIGQSDGTGLNPPTQTVPGANQWTEIWVPISGLTRIGGDQTKTLAKIVGIQFWVNALNTINVQISSIAFVGGRPLDIGDAGAPYRYRVRQRSSVTGAKSNPSPETRYGINARRQGISVLLPTVYPDPQADTWDIFRYGGSVTEYRFVGSVPLDSQIFNDIYDDAAATAGDALDFDNFQPWPTVDLPFSATGGAVTGTTCTINVSSITTPLFGRYLPGTLVQINGLNVYTLRSRPIEVNSPFPRVFQYRLEFVENAGVIAAGASFNIYEPAVAGQPLPYVWGTDVEGTAFACGDPLRPSTLYFSKGNDMDAAPDSYNIEIVQPSEPLLGGEILDGLSFVGSTERWWALYPQNNPSQRYSFVQQPWPRGIAAPFGHCNDGKTIYWFAKDGIYSSSAGSLTDADLYTLFPHDGNPGKVVTYNSATFQPPDYSRAGQFRLAYAQGYLYATYVDSTGTYHTLVCELRRGAWSMDDYSPQVTVFYHPEYLVGSLASAVQSTPVLYNALLMGTVGSSSQAARVAIQQDLANDLNLPISCNLATREFDGGDIRAGMEWGDVFIDYIGPTGPLVQVMNLGQVVTGGNRLAASAARTQFPYDAQVLADFFGIQLTWTDDYRSQAVQTKFYTWQPSYLVKPEEIIGRPTDWDDAGVVGAKWVQGFILHADTGNQPVDVVVQDADAMQGHPFTGPSVLFPGAVVHNGESELAYSFNTPFIAHMMRMYQPFPGNVEWRLWEVRWIVQPTPEFAQTWTTQPSTYGLKGFMHMRQVSLAYASSAVATLTITVYDGTAPQPVTLPSTGGVVKKIVFPLTANKGQLYTHSITSNAPVQVYLDKSEALVGAWGRQDAYENMPLTGGVGGDKAEV